jgi:hypothetical protein
MMASRQQLRPQTSESSLVSLVSATSLGSSSSDAFGGSTVSLNDYTTDDENAKVDDDALTELIRKLRGQTAGNTTAADSPSVAATASVDGSGMEDDLIEKHLKALADSTNAKKEPGKLKANKRIVAEEETDCGENCHDDDSEEGSNLMDDDDALSGDDTDDESQASIDYDQAEHLAQQLGVISQEGASQDHKQLLQSLVQSSSKFDYQGAPKTATTQRAWLTSLAKDLLREDSSSDDEESSVGLVKYETNISDLAKAGENARKLIDSSTKQQEKLIRWREKHRSKQPKFHARKPKQLLKASDIEAKLSFGSTNSTTTSNIDRQSQHAEGPSSGSNFTDIDSVFTPVDRIFPDELTVFGNASTMFSTTWLEPVKPTAEIIVPIIPKKQPKKSGKKIGLKVIVEAAKEERSRAKLLPKYAGHHKSIDERDSSGTAPGASTVPSAGTHVDKVVDMKQSETEKGGPSHDHSEPEIPKVPPPVVIPSGMPPYPGFGPKWPWHPYSARAPPGYRECYMHHMGDCYFSYMDYLRTRAENGGVDDDQETQHEKILRISLRQEAKFKKPKPALCPYTFTARPGRARENCAVGGGGKAGGITKATKIGGGGGVMATMPKIEEGSNSSSSRASSDTNSFEKKIQQKKTQPDVFTVGKYHSKAKGRKAKIVVVSGAELDRQAKQKNKTLQQQQKKKKPHSNNSNTKLIEAATDQEEQQKQEKPDTSNNKKLVEAVLSNHSAKDRSTTEQPHDLVESKCMCIIM